ncbi:MAG: EscN/YscN/HrcN family type III secretion system ATPase, partial [Firmicutes bacterium]|nr:EscN/YscN/HrcN family type III secretion system ATPase [Bacillota bacterium]
HIVLTRELAARQHYPAIDVLNSVSRLMPDLVNEEHLRASSRLRHLLATHKQAEDLINVGAYAKGSNPEIDEAVKYHEQITGFLRQGMNEKSTYEQAMQGITFLQE